ncbi:hypothetical protein PENTCL1PPCAC_5158, partial [Pristionchus entomophagus]
MSRDQSMVNPSFCPTCNNKFGFVAASMTLYCTTAGQSIYQGTEEYVGNLTCIGTTWQTDKGVIVPAPASLYCGPATAAATTTTPMCPDLLNAGGPATCTKCSGFTNNSTNIFCPPDYSLTDGSRSTTYLTCNGTTWKYDQGFIVPDGVKVYCIGCSAIRLVYDAQYAPC